MAADQQFGLTPALSVELPSEAQKRDSEALLEELRRQGTFETTAETQRRQVENSSHHVPLLFVPLC